MVAAGNVTNKRGYIPEAGDMIELIYVCDLEKDAGLLINGCPTNNKFSYSGAYNFLGATVGTTPEDATTKWYTEYTDGNVRWPRKNILIKTQVNNAQFVSFANMINANTSAVGCAYKDCTYPTNQKGAIILCIYDSPALAVGTQLYKSGEACMYCPTTCNDQLCVRQPDTTTPPTTTTPTTTAPTTAPTTATTAAGGGSTGCSPDQSQDVRNRALDMINYRRSELAKGAVAKNNGALLPSAANMRKITYDCALEGEAMAYAQQCTNAGSNQLGITENFEHVPATDPVKAMAVATRTWWKQVRLQPGIGVKMVTFRDKHMSSPIRFFTVMGWADVQRMGCI
ncbi:hypothetical protein Q1695_008727 [Nippostrongylus brasiliensis]|nr:hypothetical protein Q1695_008727 [Nippostrongylus brasiliensis]